MKMNLSRGRLHSKKERMMRTSLLHIQPPEAIVPSIPPPEARPAIHKFYTRDRNVLLVRNLGVEDKDI